DEATSSLDPQTTRSILTLIRDLHQKLGITVALITHQMSVIKEICTEVAVLDAGMIVEQGAVDEVFTSPKTAAARELVYA
ncbi:MAG: methionine ABC transporter ATP-binding protein, partial [Treponema sp.]|nr:methionine ABC transporter ATP-binding protein [Treponema sp.]